MTSHLVTPRRIVPPSEYRLRVWHQVDVAQLVERLLAMQQAEGSSPFFHSVGFHVFRGHMRDSVG